MAVFFIIVSLMLNVLLIFAVVLLYLRQNKLFGMEDTQKRTLKEMEELISTYLIEMKEENEQFINRAKEINEKNSDNHSSDTFVRSIDAYSRSGELDKKKEEPLSNRLGKTVSLHAVKAYEKQITEQSTKRPNESLIDQILTLKEKGLTEDELAKKFNKGKTEIELLLKFQEKK